MAESDATHAPPLARAGIDRAAAERDDADLLERLRGDAETRVVAVHGDRGLVEADGSRVRTVAPSEIDGDAEWAFLGRDGVGRAVLLAAVGAHAPAPVASPQEAEWAALRAAGGELDPVDAGLLVEAVSLGRWLVDAPYCPACGARTQTRSAGWARVCPACGRQHFPRTDPAVIVAVRSADGDRLLLGKNALWAERNMYSTFAGFVEAGESLEATIVREVREEAGVDVASLRYLGSQAWPYPRSLMLGFHAVAPRDAEPHPDGEEIVDVRWFTREEVRAAMRGESAVALPGTASIARALIESWLDDRPGSPAAEAAP